MQNRSILLVRSHFLHIYGPRLGAKAAFSAKCQEADWKNGHKKGCEFQRICNEFNEKAKREQPSNERPPDGYCTGCNLEFNDEDDDCDLFCEACGYQACESCSAHHSKGTNFFIVFFFLPECMKKSSKSKIEIDAFFSLRLH